MGSQSELSCRRAASSPPSSDARRPATGVLASVLAGVATGVETSGAAMLTVKTTAVLVLSPGRLGGGATGGSDGGSDGDGGGDGGGRDGGGIGGGAACTQMWSPAPPRVAELTPGIPPHAHGSSQSSRQQASEPRG